MVQPDFDLLREYAVHRSESAFAELVRRHLNLVFSAALRQVHSRELAEEIAQSVFAELARQSATLRGDSVIPAWLYEVTRRKAVDAIRQNTRRQARELTSLEHVPMNDHETDPVWSEVAPLLDEAMQELAPAERSVIVLRFFENRAFRDVGSALGISDDAAQKRVTRAIERMRQFFAARGVTVSAAAISGAISAHAVQAAPAGLFAAISAHAAFVPLATTATLFAMTTLQKTAVALVVAAGLTGTIYEAARAHRLEMQLTRFTTGAQPNAAAPSPAAGTNLAQRVALLEQENENLRRNSAELAQLRAEVTRLSSAARDRKAAEPFAEVAIEWKKKAERLHEIMQQHPEQNVPELLLLDDRAWLDTARDADLETDKGVRQTTSSLRHSAKNAFVMMLSEALAKYVAQNEGQLPADLSELRPHLPEKATDAMLDRYKMTETGNIKDLPGNPWVTQEKAVVDPEFDRLWRLSPNGYTTTDPRLADHENALGEVTRAYLSVNKHPPAQPSDLLPYAKSDAQQTAVRILQEQKK